LVPRSDRDWDPHASYHLDGKFHHKSYDRKALPPQQRQPLTAAFCGAESLGVWMVGDPKDGLVCDPGAFSRVIQVAPGVLGPRQGQIVVDLVQPNCVPISQPFAPGFRQEIFQDFVPWLVISVGQMADPATIA
jgi:hypothetical protein